MKLLVLIAVLAVAYLLWRNKRLGGAPGASRTSGMAGAADAARDRARPAAPQPMIACARCGLHLPREDALDDGRGRLFCSAQHRDLPSP